MAFLFKSGRNELPDLCSALKSGFPFCDTCKLVFPDDGHPDMCAEVIHLTGDHRDEIVLWDHNKMYIYTQDRPCEMIDREYVPQKYPHYNSSNYRGEFSFARWIPKK